MSVSINKENASAPNWEARAMFGAYEGVGARQAAKTNVQFQEACIAAGAEPTARQYRKWRNKRGIWR